MTADDRPVRTLLVDNYDSYTYNLFQLLAVANGVAPTVVRNDEADWAEIVGQAGFDNIVISPGPGVRSTRTTSASRPQPLPGPGPSNCPCWASAWGTRALPWPTEAGPGPRRA